MEIKGNLSQKLFEEYQLRFDSFTDEEIIEAFNSQVGNGGTGTAKMTYLRAIRSQLIKRNIDFSEVGDERTMSYKRKVNLNGKKIVIVENKGQ